MPFAPPTNSPSSPRRRVIETESEDEGLDGAHYRRLWRTQCQHVRGWKRKHEVLTERFDKLRLCYAHMEKKKNDAIFMAFFLKAQNHFLQFKGKSPLIFYIQNFPNQKKNYFSVLLEYHPRFKLALELVVKVLWAFYNQELEVVDEGIASYEDSGLLERPEGEIEYLARCSVMFEKLGYLKMHTGENPVITAACFQAIQVDVSTLPPPCQSKNINGHFRRHQFDFLSHLNMVLTVRSSLDDEEN